MELKIGTKDKLILKNLISNFNFTILIVIKNITGISNKNSSIKKFYLIVKKEINYGKD